MRFYTATRIENAPAARELRDLLQAAGWECAYDWTVHGSVRGDDADRGVIGDIADREARGVLESMVFVILLPGGRGAHVELGIAMGVSLVLRALLREIDLACSAPRVFIWSPQPDVDFGLTEATSSFYHHRVVEQRREPTIAALAAWLVENLEDRHVVVR